MLFDWSALTAAQHKLLLCGGYDPASPFTARPCRGTVAPLLSAGWLVEHSGRRFTVPAEVQRSYWAAC